jgi:hypothetical protein
VSVTAERLLNALGKLADDAEVRALLRDLDLPEKPAKIADGVASDYEAPNHGVAIFFRTAHHLRNIEAYRACPPETPIVSDVIFSRKGFGGGPGFSGELPHGLTFSESREAARARLGPPSSSGLAGANDRWDFGQRYLTVAFFRDPTKGVMQVTCGLDWVI